MYTRKIILIFISFLFCSSTIFSQSPSFQLELEEDTLPGMPGLQSFVYGQADGKWLLIGGRTEGLHQRQPFASFPANQNNTNLYVVDPVLKQVWSASLSSLASNIAEQLQSTNMNFNQVGDQLYIVGGYAYSASVADHITYPSLTIINVAPTIQNIVSGSSFSLHIRQINDPRFAITGGALGYLDSTFYLVGGQRFTGRYNPINNPTFTQEYSNEIRTFRILDSLGTPVVKNYSVQHDTAALHRRDYNMLAQVFPNGQRGFTAFSGVFQYGVNLPWLNTVDIVPGAYQVRPNFNQYLNQYHSAKTAIWDSLSNTMYSVFFGGISRYTLDTVSNTLIDDPNVPFVKTISMITRFANDSMTETKLGIEMPALLGSGAEYIPKSEWGNHIQNFHVMPASRTHIGTIVGGIESSAPNIFFINTGVESMASTRIFKVYLKKDNTTGISNVTLPDKKTVLQTFPNPAAQESKLIIQTSISGELNLNLLDMEGRQVRHVYTADIKAGRHELIVNVRDLPDGIYLVSLQIGAHQEYARLLVAH